MVVLPADLTTALCKFAAGRETTLSNVVLAVFKLFLFRWTRQDDICVGMSVANRNHPDTESLIGFFVNILPIRTRMSADMEFDDLLRQVEQTCHKRSNVRIIRSISWPQTQSHAVRQSPIDLNVVYNYLSHGAMYVDGQGNGCDNRFDTRNRRTTPPMEAFEYTFSTSKFDLTLYVFDAKKNINLTIEYDSGLFVSATVRQGSCHPSTLCGDRGGLGGGIESRGELSLSEQGSACASRPEDQFQRSKLSDLPSAVGRAVP